jgi:hypothetical protein
MTPAPGQLGQTRDPRALIPGDHTALRSYATALTTRGDGLSEIGAALKRIDMSEAWSGQAANAFTAKYIRYSPRWLNAGTSHHDVATAISRYADTLDWAQAQASDAARVWDQSLAATQTAVAAYNQRAATGAVQGPFIDPGQAGREVAQARLSRARDQLAGAGDAAVPAITAAAQTAPQQSLFFRAGNALSDAANGAITTVENLIDDPRAALTVAAGAGLTAVSGTGELAGLALDAVPGGALVGLPVNALTAAGITAGVGMMAAGMSQSGSDADQPHQIDDPTSAAPPEPAERLTPPQRLQKVYDRLNQMPRTQRRAGHEEPQ